MLDHLINYDLKTLNLGVIILIETWLKESKQDFVNIKGYKFIGQPRPTRKGGGVGVLIRQDLDGRVVYKCIEKELECMIVEMKGKEKELIGAAYRPPNTDISKFLEHYDKMANLYKHRPLILGINHNLDLLKSELHGKTQKFLELNYDHDLLPCITKPTRVT